MWGRNEREDILNMNKWLIGLVFVCAVALFIQYQYDYNPDPEPVENRVVLRLGDNCYESLPGLSEEDYYKMENFLCKAGYDCSAMGVCN